jgi:hypothetical protein
MSKDYSRHIVENIAKGSSMCPFGSEFVNSKVNSQKSKLAQDFDLFGYDSNDHDTDDEPLSDIEL